MKKSKAGFTLQEILVVIALVALLITGVLALVDPMTQFKKARDSKRKSDLNKLRTILEDFYNDHGCYPLPTEICYDAATDDDIPCHICGEEADPLPNFSLPCNSSHPEEDYLYDVQDVSCPQWYRIYTSLQWENDEDIIEVGCGFDGCGPAPDYGYNYGVTNPGSSLERNLYLYCYDPADTCGICGSAEICQDSLDRGSCLSIYTSQENCCNANPGSGGCDL